MMSLFCQTFAKTIQYKGQAKFKLISVDFQVIEQYVSKELTLERLNEDNELFSPNIKK